ncbi:dimethyladenosine transferase [Sulfuritortus calidifontis]|uniref:Ribosomal RNA small subunit methyltransferase A n=1 Tax=Sulfuritortus calidifontis TaxID=1914471 RepID=A0A4R3JZ12_9PROT|nr:16S rRNA (adenine(1518)-N(6)/adenine(1519)-N(6))-dimethyltransferase RsmA [Sulfuritortus calidifontis]TCS72617.1 dimethyladenosine transferase [Sulfuritortus calidifontis]
MTDFSQAHRPRKALGQNFLHDPGVLAKIVAAIAPQPDDHMVEIGPGLGALTRPLLERLKHLDVVEFDRDLVARLRTGFPPDRLTVHEGDALKFDFASLGDNLRVVGNLPYNISSPLLFHLTEYAERIRDMHFMLQKEVVDRMAAQPDTPDYGRLSVMLQARFRVAKLFTVPPGAFRPPPKVDSAVVRLAPLPPEAIPYRDAKAFAEVVARAFGQRRKTLRNTLKGLIGAEQLQAIGIDPGRRGETLSVAEFAKISQLLR